MNLRFTLLTAWLLMLLVACDPVNRNHQTSTMFGNDQVTDTTEGDVYDLPQIERSGEIIAVTMSGPETYFEFRGMEMGLQYEMAEAFASRRGLRLRMETARDTAEMLQLIRQGDVDFIAYEMDCPADDPDLTVCAGQWISRQDAPLLTQALTDWYRPELREQLAQGEKEKMENRVRKQERPVMLSAQTGTISTYDKLFQRHSAQAGWDWRLLAAQCWQESGFDPRAESFAGAKGLMQLMPRTAEGLDVHGDQIWDPETNIAAAARYIRQLQGQFRDIPGAEDRINFVLASYNGGVGHVRDAMALCRKHGGDPTHWSEVDPWILRLSEPAYYRDPVVKHGYLRGRETSGYVQGIRARYNGYLGTTHSFQMNRTPAPAKSSTRHGEYQSHVKTQEEYIRP